MGKKKNSIHSYLILFFLIIFLGSSPVKIQDLPPKYRTWLAEEVVYVITEKEKSAFLQLESDRERDLFIEAFWRQRDPVPETPENEFKVEHYRRISYANKAYGKGSSKAGWKTDRGRIYIILGKPGAVTSYGEESLNLVPIEVWFYQGDYGGGLPSTFYVVFFQEEGIGDYILYSPLRHGPRKLLESYDGDPNQAIKRLMRVDRELAGVSRSLVPGELGISDSKSALNSEMVLNKIEVSPQKKVNDLYADKLLKYKSLVEVDSSVNYVGNEALLKVMRESEGRHFVHYAVEPNRLSIGSSGGKYFIHLELFGKISDTENATVYQFQKNVKIDFLPDEVAEMKAKRFSFQDAFPLIEGRFRFDLLIKNPVSKEFTSFESEIVVPTPESVPVLSPLLLSSRLDRESSRGSNLRPFRMGDVQTYPVANRTFAKGDRLCVSFQIGELAQGLREAGSLEYSLFREGKKVHFLKKTLKDIGSSKDIFEEFSLSDFDPGLYAVDVRLLDQDAKEVGFSKEDFSISIQRSLPAVWSLSETLPPLDDPYYAYVLGMESLNSGRIEQAKSLLEKAHREKPVSLEFALGLGQAYFRSAEYQKVHDVLIRFLEKAKDRSLIYELLGRSSFLQNDYGRAIYYFKKYLSHFGTNLDILNILAECFYQSGEFEEAKAAWKKSLEIEPGQEQIRKKLEAVEKKSPA